MKEGDRPLPTPWWYYFLLSLAALAFSRFNLAAARLASDLLAPPAAPPSVPRWDAMADTGISLWHIGQRNLVVISLPLG